jgi:hypothetical protein
LIFIFYLLFSISLLLYQLKMRRMMSQSLSLVVKDSRLSDLSSEMSWIKGMFSERVPVRKEIEINDDRDSAGERSRFLRKVKTR